MARQDEADLRRVAQRVEEREVLGAGYAEDVVDALAQQSVDQRARAGDGLDGLAFGGIHVTLLCVAGRPLRHRAAYFNGVRLHPLAGMRDEG
ncbi:hypothetical protein D3C83_37710 [compost metagenome]